MGLGILVQVIRILCADDGNERVLRNKDSFLVELALSLSLSPCLRVARLLAGFQSFPPVPGEYPEVRVVFLVGRVNKRTLLLAHYRKLSVRAGASRSGSKVT